jgi:transcriptional regulator with XRE-family HTH domain
VADVHLPANLGYLFDGVRRDTLGRLYDREDRTVRRWLSGASAPKLSMIARIADAADVDPGHLIYMDPAEFRARY